MKALPLLLLLACACTRSVNVNRTTSGGNATVEVNTTMTTSMNGVGIRVRSHLLNANMESVNGATRIVATHDGPVDNGTCRDDAAQVEAETLDGRPCPIRSRVLGPTICLLEVSVPATP